MEPKRLFVWSIAAAALFLLSLAEASLGGSRGSELAVLTLLGVPAACVGLCGSWILVRWLSAQDLFAPWIAFPIAYVAWFSIGLLSASSDLSPASYEAISLGIVCYLAGVGLARAWTCHRIDASRLHFHDAWSTEYFGPFLAAIGMLTLLGYLSVGWQVGVPGFRSDAGEARLDLLKHTSTQTFFVLGAWTIIVFLATRLWVRGQKTVSKVELWLALVVTSLLILSLGSRGNLFQPIATVLIARHYLHRRTKIGLTSLGVAVAFVAASALGWARDTMAYTSSTLRDLEFNPASLYYLYFYISTPVRTLGEIMQRIPRYVPYQHGYLSFGALASALPGFHNESSDMFFRRILGSEFIGFGQPATLLGPMYGDFGMTGVALQMFGVGIFYVWMYSWMCRRPTFFRAVMYAWVSQVIIYGLFGSLLPFITGLVAPLGWILLDRIIRLPPVGTRSLSSAIARTGDSGNHA